MPSRPVTVVDTLGAGDAFMTGLIDALWSQDLLGADHRTGLARISLDALTDVIKTTVVSSALTVVRAGADLPDRATPRCRRRGTGWLTDGSKRGYLLAIVQLNEPVVPIRERSSQYFGSLSELDVSIVG